MMSQSFAGTLLVASPYLADPMFARSVCLVIHHDQEGAVGVLLNRPFEPALPGLWQMIQPEQQAPETGRVVHFGGPMTGPVVALHGRAALAEAETGDGVYVAAQKEHLQELFRGPSDQPVRLIVGHAGWKAGQLETQVEQGYWYILPATAENVFEPDDQMWADLVRKAATGTLAQWVGAKHIPPDPAWN